jgi:hypothetical protein
VREAWHLAHRNGLIAISLRISLTAFALATVIVCLLRFETGALYDAIRRRMPHLQDPREALVGVVDLLVGCSSQDPVRQ